MCTSPYIIRLLPIDKWWYLVFLQPRQNLLSAANRIGEASHDIMRKVGEDEDETDRAFEVNTNQSYHLSNPSLLATSVALIHPPAIFSINWTPFEYRWSCSQGPSLAFLFWVSREIAAFLDKSYLNVLIMNESVSTTEGKHLVFRVALNEHSLVWLSRRRISNNQWIPCIERSRF